MLFAIYVLLHIILTTIYQAIVLYKCFRMFTVKHLHLSASPLLLLFFSYLTVESATALFYTTYVLIFWRPNEIIYQSITMYLIGIIPWILLISNPIFEFALCVERCCVVLFPYTYFNHWKRIMCMSVFFIATVTLLLMLWINDFIWLPPSGISECRYFSCVITAIPARYMNAYKIVISVLEVIAALALMFLVKFKKLTMSKKGKKKNIVILIVIFSTLLFEFGPNIADTVYFHYTEKYLINAIGPYRTTLSSLNISINNNNNNNFYTFFPIAGTQMKTRKTYIHTKKNNKIKNYKKKLNNETNKNYVV